MTGRKSEEKKDRDRMSIRMVSCEFINNIKSEIDERVREAGKEKDAEGERKREKSKRNLFI